MNDNENDSQQALSSENIYTWILFVVFGVALTVSLNALIQFSATQATAARTSQVRQYTAVYDGAILETSKGDVEIDLHHRRAPMTVNNFIKLVKKDFYNGTRFHHVLPQTLVQAGDPLSKDIAKKRQWGTGGPGYSIKKEESKMQLDSGAVAMANGKQTDRSHGSQFFIFLKEDSSSLQGEYTVFASVRGGMSVLERIGNVPTDEQQTPTDPVLIEEVRLY